MSTINDGGPAFPTPWTNDGDVNATAPDGTVVAPGMTIQLHGMSLRDYIAIQAMLGFCSNNWIVNSDVKREELSTYAYQVADAMLTARAS